MRRLVHGLVVAVPALLVGASAVQAADPTCTSTLSGKVTGNVVVPAGASCTLSNATVTGDVKVLRNGALTVDATAQLAEPRRLRAQRGQCQGTPPTRDVLEHLARGACATEHVERSSRVFSHGRPPVSLC